VSSDQSQERGISATSPVRFIKSAVLKGHVWLTTTIRRPVFRKTTKSGRHTLPYGYCGQRSFILPFSKMLCNALITGRTASSYRFVMPLFIQRELMPIICTIVGLHLQSTVSAWQTRQLF